MAVMKGYKQTEVGVIPDAWKCATVQELLDSGDIVEHLDGNHGELYPRSHEFTTNGVPYITANDLVDNRVDFSRCKHLSDARAKRFRKGVAKHGDVLFAHNATVGPAAILRTELDCVILSTTVTYYRCRTERLHNPWLLYGLQALTFVAQYRAIMSQSTRNQVPITAQRKLTLVVPSFPEQEAIAGALSDADAWIESLEQLIAKKRQIKQGAMQELLTGKRRLPGFSGKWETKRLGDLAVLRNGYAFKSDTYADSGSFKVVTIANVQDGRMDIAECNSVADLPRDLQDHHRLSLGDLLISMTGNVGRVCRVSCLNCLLNQRVGLVVPLSTSAEFLYHLLCQRSFLVAMVGKAKGGAQGNLSKGDILEFELTIPNSLDEQQSIATVLSDMDTEIESLESKLAKAREVKQGMMQELLTGRIRLV